jgi:hypothetical protein
MCKIIPCIMLLVRQPFPSVVSSKKFHINKGSIVQIYEVMLLRMLKNTFIKSVVAITQNIKHDFFQLWSKKLFRIFTCAVHF